MKPPPTLPPCYQPINVSGACPVCGARLEPAHYQVAQERLSCAACCVICRPPEPLDGPLRETKGEQGRLW